jgi:hypothetical protein
MGLSISVEQTRLPGLSSALAEDGVIWREPDGPPTVEARPHADAFPYSFLHYLRRVYALVDNGQPVTPAHDMEDVARDDQWVRKSSVMLESHLLCHSDSAGYYVPVDFHEARFLLEFGDTTVGSSQQLLSELCRCAPALGIRLDGVESGTDLVDALSDVEAARLFELSDDDDFGIESTVWLTLFEACRVSIATGHAIVFH